MQLRYYIQHPTPRVRRRAYHIHSEEREGTMEKVSFDNARRRGGADSDQCRPRGWHHQLQIVPPPLTPRTLAQQPVIAPTRAANNRGGRRDSELGKGAQLVPFPSLFSKFDNAVADRSHFHNWARCSFPQFLYAPKLFSAARQFSYHHSSIVVTAQTRGQPFGTEVA